MTTESGRSVGFAGLFSDGRVVSLPNAISLVRLACIPLFVWLLFAKDAPVAAAFLLGGLGATDWVDGWIARRFDQTSELGKVLDPTADRLLFIVGIAALIIDGSAPLWFCWAVVIREFLVGAAMVICTLAFEMERFDVTYWGKLATFLLMFTFPGFLLGSTDFPAHELFRIAAWILGIPGLVLSWYTAIAYVPMIRSHLHARRNTTATDDSGTSTAPAKRRTP